MAWDFLHVCMKKIRLLMVSLDIIEFTVDCIMLGTGQGALDSLPK